MDTKTLRSDAKGARAAAVILRGGGLVAFPTETVYGLGADARNDAAVAGIYTAKGRPDFNPLIVHVADLTAAKALGVFDAVSLKLAAAFWPGPLSLVVPMRDGHGLSPRVTAGLTTVAIRVPAQPVARQLLTEFGGPVAAPSANSSGFTSPTEAAHVLRDLGGKIDAVLDGGACAVGLESTILMSDENGVHLLRHGGIPREDVEALVGVVKEPRQDPDAPNAPGQLLAHYAPRLPLRINVTDPQPDEFFISLDDTSDLAEEDRLKDFAQRLYRELHHAADKQSSHRKSKIAVGPVPMRGLGVAINDRLQRAVNG